jgi:hypothetical protein
MTKRVEGRGRRVETALGRSLDAEAVPANARSALHPLPSTLDPFVQPGSVVREIWGDADVILLVFAGAAAEFALNRAVDWLFFTGAIPSDPIGRFFVTARYAQEIAFADREIAEQALARIRSAHEAVEQARGARIPDWSHRDVLYFLIDYSERSHELLDRSLTSAEQDELYDVFRRVGEGLGIPDLPPTYADWRVDRERHLRRDLAFSAHTAKLYAQYRQHLGPWRYWLLRHLQAVLTPSTVARLLDLRPAWWVRPAIRVYRVLSRLGLRPLVRVALLPARYVAEVARLDVRAA